MTVTMRNAAEQAAYDLGRATAKYEMLAEGLVTTQAMAGNYIGESLLGHTAYPGSVEGTADGSIASKPSRRLPKAYAKGADAPKATKAPVVARGVKAAPKTREKGVKKAIVELIADEGVNGGIVTGDIVSRLGFKASSVNSTLAGLKKEGIAMQEGKLWLPAPHSDTGNSDAAAHADF